MKLNSRLVGVVACALAILVVPERARAEVTKLEIATRSPLGDSGYEKVVGTVRFAVDPKNPRNAVVADLDKAPVNAAGLVEFSADVYIVRPIDPARSNGVVVFDVLNRGRKLLMRFSSTGGTDGDEGDTASPCPAGPAPGAPAPAAGAAATGRPAAGRAASTGASAPNASEDISLGDGLLTRDGSTLVWVGWQFDVRRRGNAMGIDLPHATGTSQIVSAVFTPCDARPNQTVTDLAGYSPTDPRAADTVLTVRDDVFSTPETIARDRWKLEGSNVTMAGGFQAGRIYELSYRTSNPPVTGLGLAGFRDLAAWMKHSPDAPSKARYLYAFGSSQSGRFLREFLYDGFNTDERGGQVFDAVWAHIAGAARLDINRRGGTPNALSMFTYTQFPFATTAQRDPISGRTDGLLENDRARANQPKVFFTNSSVEQWGGGRAAPLITTTADGKSDLPLAPNVRYYYFAGTQHSPGRFPPRQVTGAQPYNPVDYWFAMRALYVAFDGWVRKGEEPPASQYPRLADKTLVPVKQIAFPAVPGVRSPASIPAGRQEGKPVPFLVPQVDADGNDLAGLRLPDVAAPLATYTGWNFRNPVTGGDTLLVSLLGSAVPFPRTKEEREQRRDPRRAIAERYSSQSDYMARAREVTEALVKGRYVLAQDAPKILERSTAMWRWATDVH